MSFRFMPRDRQLLLLFGALATLLLASVAISLAIYQTAASSVSRHHTAPRSCRRGMLSTTFLKRSGLGNLLFQYAAGFALAKSRGCAFVLPPDFRLREYFELSAGDFFKAMDTSDWHHYYELKSSAYDDLLVSELDPCFNSMLVGYLQSYLYFDRFAVQVRSSLTFKDEIKEKANAFLLQSYDATYGKTNPKAKIVYVAIHVRRGDMISRKSLEYGYTTPGKDYYTRAVKHMIKRHAIPEKRQNVLFIVSSDDIAWCEDNMDDLPGVFVFTRANADYIDLAILSQCNHTITSAGTFSWWAGWLSHGDVVYYKGYPVKNTKLEKSFSTDRLDYYPSAWIEL